MTDKEWQAKTVLAFIRDGKECLRVGDLLLFRDWSEGSEIKVMGLSGDAQSFTETHLELLLKSRLLNN